MNLYTRTYSDQDLQIILQAVVDAEGKEHALTQSQYDKAREEHGYAHTPRAKYIAKRLGASWKYLAAKALQAQAQSEAEDIDATAEATSSTSASYDRRKPSEVISHAVVRHTMSLISKRLKTDSLNAGQYERERKTIIAEALDPEEAYALEEALPSAQRLQRVYKTWAEVCRVGGIERPGKGSGNRERFTQPGSYDLAACKAAMLEALAWAAEENLDLTQRAYQQFSVGREGTPSLRAMQDVLKKEAAGSFAEFRERVQAQRLKQKV